MPPYAPQRASAPDLSPGRCLTLQPQPPLAERQKEPNGHDLDRPPVQPRNRHPPSSSTDNMDGAHDCECPDLELGRHTRGGRRWCYECGGYEVLAEPGPPEPENSRRKADFPS
jgi:hypothetical protein